MYIHFKSYHKFSDYEGFISKLKSAIPPLKQINLPLTKFNQDIDRISCSYRIFAYLIKRISIITFHHEKTPYSFCFLFFSS